MKLLPDFRAYVHGVDFKKIACFIRDNCDDNLAVTIASGRFDPAAHDAAWEQKFAVRHSAFSASEKMLTHMALASVKYIPDINWAVWPDQTEAQRLDTAEATVDAVTRLYLYKRIQTEHGDQTANLLKHKLMEACFCTPDAGKA